LQPALKDSLPATLFKGNVTKNQHIAYIALPDPQWPGAAEPIYAFATVIYCDNQGAIALAANPTDHGCTKHVDIQRKFVGEKVASGEIELVYTPTEQMVAGGLTKALPKAKFEALHKALGLEWALHQPICYGSRSKRSNVRTLHVGKRTDFPSIWLVQQARAARIHIFHTSQRLLSLGDSNHSTTTPWMLPKFHGALRGVIY